MARVVVVGAGLGGLASAARLAAQGHAVTVLEQSEQVGGKLGLLTVDGHAFDTGPSLVTLPQVYRDLFAATGTERFVDEIATGRLAEHAELARSWVGATLGGYQVGASLPGGRLRVHDPAAGVAVDADGAAADEDPRRGVEPGEGLGERARRPRDAGEDMQVRRAERRVDQDDPLAERREEDTDVGGDEALAHAALAAADGDHPGHRPSIA